MKIVNEGKLLFVHLQLRYGKNRLYFNILSKLKHGIVMCIINKNNYYCNCHCLSNRWVVNRSNRSGWTGNRFIALQGLFVYLTYYVNSISFVRPCCSSYWVILTLIFVVRFLFRLVNFLTLYFMSTSVIFFFSSVIIYGFLLIAVHLSNILVSVRWEPTFLL